MTQQTESKTGQWMALLAALLGWMFDGFEIGLFPITGRPALTELLTTAARESAVSPLSDAQMAEVAASVNSWFGVIIAVFLVGAATGGVLFGWLGDRIGRVRAMSLSILAYALFTGACGFANDAWQIAGLRFLASLGMGGEWSLGVALVNEIWPGKSRAFVAGLIGAAANVGFALVAILSISMVKLMESLNSGMLSIGLPGEFVERLLSNKGWRFLMVSGALPALLTFFVRVCVPESKKWEEEKASGRTGFWSNSDLYGVLVGCLGAMLVIFVWTPSVQNTPLRLIATAIGLAIALMGFLYPVWQFMGRATAAGTIAPKQTEFILRRMMFGAALAGVALLGTWGSVQWLPKWASENFGKLPGVEFPAEYTQLWSAAGAIIGTIIAALAADRLGRRLTYALICLTSLIACVALHQLNNGYTDRYFVLVFLAGGTTAAMYGFFPLYFPELFPTAVRATAQGFCFNFGRVLAAVGTLQMPTLIIAIGSYPKAGTVLSAIYLLGAVLIWFGPETKGQPLPD